MKRMLCALLGALFCLALAACAPGGGAAQIPVTPSPTVEASAPASAAPVPSAAPAGRFGFSQVPVTEEAVTALFEGEGSRVVELTPWEGDYLAEVTDYGGEDPMTLLYWIFGATGRRVQMNGMEDMESYEITGRGAVSVRCSGASASVPWKSAPYTAMYQVQGDENGTLDNSSFQCLDSRAPSWLDPAEPLYIGWWDGDGGPSTDSGRCEQLYDARVDADGLSFAFIPQGGKPEDVGNFTAACTTIPAFSTAFDGETRTFTLRLYNVSLESGGEGEAYGDVRYPYEFPAGSLGRDSHFITGASVEADGADVVVTCRLTDAADQFTVQSGDLSFDSIPTLRLVFRTWSSAMEWCP